MTIPLHPLRGVVESEYSGLVDVLAKSIGVYLDRPDAEMKSYISAMGDVFQRKGSVEDLIQVQESIGCYPGDPYIETHNLVESISYCGRIMDRAGGAQSEGIPTIPFIAWPKSGSSFIATMLCYGLDLSAVRISWRDELPVKSWIRALGRFPAVTHDHMHPSDGLATHLADSGIKKIVVHSRDARQALASAARMFVKNSDMRLSYTSINPDSGITSVVQQYLDMGWLEKYVQWHKGWIDLADDFEILFTDYDAFFADPLKGLARILEFLGTPEDIADRAIGRIVRDRDKLHFNFDVGLPDSWKEVLTAEQVDRSAAAMSAEIAKVWGRLH